MYTAILSAIIMGALCVPIFKDKDLKDWDSNDYWRAVGGTLLFGLLGFLIGLIIAFFIKQEFKEVKHSYDIECIQDNSTIGGKFYLGSGHINGSMQYTYYYKDSKGFYKLNLVKYYRAKVKFTKGKPRIEVTKYEAVTGWGFNPSKYDTYIFYIPEGSIDNNFTLDAK